MKLFEYSGVIHIHSTYSDGSGSIPEILIAARKAKNLDFLILTDHNTLAARTDNWEGWHGDTLLVVGEEISTLQGDCLTLGTQTQINPHQNSKEILKNIHQQGGLSFLAHPHGSYQPWLKKIDHSWKDWEAKPFTGLELWSYMFDWVSTFKYTRWWDHYFYPEKHIHGPHPQTLKTWDELCQTRKCVAIGGVDAHAKKYKPLPITVFPYKESFQTIRTQILLPQPLPKTNAHKAMEMVKTALQLGHCYIAYHPLGNPSGTRFGIQKKWLLMGDQIALEGPNNPGIEIYAEVPLESTLRLIRNGRKIHEKEGKTLSLSIKETGVYRLEARRNNKPWIFTNPIHILPPHTKPNPP